MYNEQVAGDLHFALFPRDLCREDGVNLAKFQ